MKKSLVIGLVAILVLLLTSASAPPAEMNGNRPIRCVIDIQVVCSDAECLDGHWEGPISGCILEGMTIEFWETAKNFYPGSTEHFFELFYIKEGDQTVISGQNAGVWNFSTFKFRANGRVEEALGPWAYLNGYKFHEMGRTSDPGLWDPPAVTVTGFGTVMTLH